MAGLSDLIGVSRRAINARLDKRRSISPEMALQLLRRLGNTLQFWLADPMTVDRTEASGDLGKTAKRNYTS
ncbi:MAG: hypothetical protein C7B45_00190 [Sulfobacillus acidophilus]|uniref:HTH cro/C1-type domain-containing protein n=1 Tax=Sulfobacillus acidophilus TaxID=53633 RepID=A0A2T2WPB2_9FIRM|nr:MAG: hypothetical protein C7B45_00190 [Sulfobacillus acidophilus]